MNDICVCVCVCVLIYMCVSYEIALGSDRDENDVVADAHLLALGALLGRRMDGPPARLAHRVRLQADVERQLVVRCARRQACQVLFVVVIMSN